MSGYPTLQLRTRSEAETEALGRALGSSLPVPAVIGIAGQLGAGKTVLARGVAGGLGIDPAAVSSPSFVYLVDYDEGRHRFVHADLYRLSAVPADQAERVYESIGLLDAIAGDDALTLVEWWDYYAGPTPERLVRVEVVLESGETRSIHLEFRGVGMEAAMAAARALGDLSA